MTKEKGFTIIELMIAMAIALIILPLGYMIIFSGSKAHLDGIDEYQLQSDMRVAAEHMNSVIRYSTVVFGVTEDDFNPNHGVPLTSGWSYIGSCPDDGIVHYQYDSSTDSHNKTILIENKDDIIFNAEFIDKNPDIDDKLVKFILTGDLTDSSKTVSIDTELQALNSLQVVDRGHEFNRSVALAYRSDPRPVAEKSHAAIAMVLDVSGSMSWNMDGNTPSWNEDSRIDILKEVAKDFVDELEHSSVSLVPFSRNANNPMSFKEVEDETGKAQLISDINSLNADGGTNTGDGLRRGYYQLEYFNDNKEAYGVADKNILNYMIILVDGVTTMASAVINVNDAGSYYLGDFVEFVDGDSDIGSSLWYRSTNTGSHRFSGNLASGTYYAYNLPRIIGHGNELDPYGEDYVDEMGLKIRNSSLDIKAFVIGFSNRNWELESVDDIADATGATSSVEGVNYYIATDQTQLEDIFEDIGGQILADLWHVSGP